MFREKNEKKPQYNGKEIWYYQNIGYMTRGYTTKLKIIREFKLLAHIASAVVNSTNRPKTQGSISAIEKVFLCYVDYDNTVYQFLNITIVHSLRIRSELNIEETELLLVVSLPPYPSNVTTV